MKKGNQVKMSYEPEADVLRIETGRDPITYAAELGNVIVHFNRNDKPIYFEILEASKFLQKAALLLPASRHPLSAIH